MIYLDIDGVLVDFYGTAEKHFGLKLEHNVFGKWCWHGSDKCKKCIYDRDGIYCVNLFPTPAEFYAVAEPQPWFDKLLGVFWNEKVNFLTKDYADIKTEWLVRHSVASVAIEAPDKSVHCKHPTDLLIDDNEQECKRWRDKGGIAYWFNLAEKDPFGEFLAWWRMGR
jgi:hypothetical protein